MRAHVVSLAWGLVVGAAVIDSGLTFDTRLFAPDFWDPTTLRLHSSDFVMSPKYFLASVMLVMFWDILLNDFHDLLDDDNSLTLSPLSLLRQSILFMAGKSGRGGRGRGGGRGGAQPGSNVVDIDVLPPPPPRTRSRGGDDGYMHEEVDNAPDGESDNDHEYGTEEPEPDARPAQRNKEAIKKKRSKKSKKRSKNRKRKHPRSDSD